MAFGNKGITGEPIAEVADRTGLEITHIRQLLSNHPEVQDPRRLTHLSQGMLEVVEGTAKAMDNSRTLGASPCPPSEEPIAAEGDNQGGAVSEAELVISVADAAEVWGLEKSAIEKAIKAINPASGQVEWLTQEQVDAIEGALREKDPESRGQLSVQEQGETLLTAAQTLSSVYGLAAEETELKLAQLGVAIGLRNLRTFQEALDKTTAQGLSSILQGNASELDDLTHSVLTGKSPKEVANLFKRMGLEGNDPLGKARASAGVTNAKVSQSLSEYAKTIGFANK